jgi:hypothetical protein
MTDFETAVLFGFLTFDTLMIVFIRMALSRLESRK